MNFESYRVWVISAIVGAFIIALVFSTTQTSEEIVIGVSLPLTGPVSPLGEWTLQGMQMAVDGINSAGGISGRPVRLIIEDDKCSASEGVKTVPKLLNSDKIKTLVVYCGAVTGAVANFIDGHALTYSISVRTEPLEGRYPFLFNMAPAPEKETDILSKYMRENGFKKAAVLHQADFFGETYKNKFKDSFTEVGGEIVLDGELDNFDKPDFRTDLLKAQERGAEAVFTSFNPPQYSVILQQAQELGMNVSFFSVWNTQSQQLLDLSGGLADGIVYTYSFREDGSAEYTNFKNRYASRFGSPPEYNAVNGYDSVMLIARVMEECGDVDCMVHETGRIENFSGLSGDFGFVNNVANKEIYLKTVRNGEFVFVSE